MKKHPTISSPKVAIIGSGAVGSAAAYALTIKNVASQIILIDRNEAKEEGEVMDISDALCFVETGCVEGGDFKDARSADVIIVTAGAAQKPGETRLDLVEKNIAITKSIFKNIGKLKKSTVVLMVSNPVDILTSVAQKISGLPMGQVFGSGTTLDTARLRSVVGRHFSVSPQSVSGFVMGEHGDSEFVAWSTVSVGGMPVTKMKGFTTTLAKKLENKVRKEAYEIIERKGATYFGIGLVISDIAEAILYDQQVILPVTAKLNNWNGVSNVCLGAPAVVGRAGVERHWPVVLPASEKRKLQKSAEVIKKYL